MGTDIVEIHRIRKLWEKRGEQFARRVLSDGELLELAAHAQPERFLAKRWAAKEAIAKALGTGFTQGVCFTDMAIAHSSNGQPIVELRNQTFEVAQALGITNWLISLSDEVHYAVAFVMAQNQDQRFPNGR
ncbi:MAG: holo-ACP synthase [Hydrogenovibrio sp.]